MNFIEYVNGLPNMKLREIEKIAEVTQSSVDSVYRWLRGGTVPKLKQTIIAEYLKRPVEELFPGEDKTNEYDTRD